MLIALGTIGFVRLVASTIRYWRYRPPACELSAAGELIDLRETLGPAWRETLVGSQGRMRAVALLPGNQQFTLEVSTKTYRLPRLPAHWEGLSIVHLTDFHFYGGVKRAYFEEVCRQAAAFEADMIVFGGDLLDDERLLDWLPETLGQLKAPLGQYFVLGNHDWYLDSAAMRHEFARLGWIDLSQRFVVIPPKDGNGESPLVLCGDESPWMGSHADLTGSPPDAFRILASHTPDNIVWARQHLLFDRLELRHLLLKGGDLLFQMPLLEFRNLRLRPIR